MAGTSAPCCPPDSEKFLSVDYSPVGFTGKLMDGTEFYASGVPAGRNGILVITDIYGTSGGRTKSLVDQFGEAGYFAVAPKLLVPALEGGTSGEGFPPDFDFSHRGKDFLRYISRLTWEGHLKPKIVATVDYMKRKGVQKIGAIGFCWGGLVLVHAFDDLAEHFVCGVIPHPSIHLEDSMGRDAIALCARVQRPILLMPTASDPKSYQKGGDMYMAIKNNNPASKTVLFKDVRHGFVPRGDLTDSVVKENVEAALNHAYAYFAKFM